MQLFTTKQPSHLSTATANHRHTQEGTLALVGSYKRLMHLHDLLYDPTCDKCQSNRSAEQAQGFHKCSTTSRRYSASGAGDANGGHPGNRHWTTLRATIQLPTTNCSTPFLAVAAFQPGQEKWGKRDSWAWGWRRGMLHKRQGQGTSEVLEKEAT